MRILILANGRTGSTNIMLGLAEGLDYDAVPEPWNRGLKLRPEYQSEGYKNFTYQNMPDNIVVKSIVNVQQYLGFYWNQPYPKFNCEGLDGLDNGSEVVFWYRFAKKFDKVIVLDRRDIDARVSSALHAQYFGKWRGAYTYTPSIIPDTETWKQLRMKEEQSSDMLKLVAHHLGLEITYYEDIFTNKVQDYFGLGVDNQKMFDNFINPKYKYKR